MELSYGDGVVAKAARTPAMRVRKSSALSSVSPTPHNQTAFRKTQQNKVVAHRFPYLITILIKLSANTVGRRQAKTACSGSVLRRTSSVANYLVNTGLP